jgi:ribonuclease BN (tRNA processing enzyme)
MNPPPRELPWFDDRPDELVRQLLGRARRVLLIGAPGVGKSHLAERLAQALAEAGRACACLGADPGSPAFGVPGALALAVREAGQWRVLALEALCTLDAGRFRLPLVAAAQRLAAQAPPGILLIDAPGVVRGIAGAELLQGLLAATAADLVLALQHEDAPLPLADELGALAVEVVRVKAAALAQHPGRQQRARARTACWDAYLHDAVEQTLERSQVRILGTAPPLAASAAWIGRQVAVSDGSGPPLLGEVLALRGEALRVRLPRALAAPRTLLVRDAGRSLSGRLETAPAYAHEPLEYLPPPDVAPFARAVAAGGPWVAGEVGNLSVILVNGVFGDPLLYVRLRHQRRSLLFDLGASVRLAARVAHQVTDVFISHAHLDHIGGFFWLLRARIGAYPACRVYGPPGLARHIEALIGGILWDRIEDRGPRFEIAELHDRRLLRYRIQTGQGGLAFCGEEAVADGVIRTEDGFRIRAVTLDHGTPVLAYAFEPAQQINIRKDRLRARGCAPGPWLSELKQRLVAGEVAAPIALPDGSRAAAGALGDELALILPGRKLVYATDFADTPHNRARLIDLAQGAHTLFCEAAFLDADAAQAAHTGHLTTRACGEIAAAAGVTRLVPFHFSLRNSDCPERIYEEIRAVCPQLAGPKRMQVFAAAPAARPSLR